MRHVLGVVVFACILQVAAPAALVDNFSSLGLWNRYSDGTTYAAWDFGTSSKIVAPDDSYNPYNSDGIGTNDDLLEAIVYPSTGEKRWSSEKYGRSGVWALSGDIYATIPNSENTGPETSKKVMVQLVWHVEDSYSNVCPAVDMYTDCEDGISETEGASIACISNYALEDGWVYSAYLIEWPTNPTYEDIHISGHVYVDSLIIDTICIPEPTTLAIMGFGVMAMWRLRKK